MDLLMDVLWTLLAAASVWLVVRLPAADRGAWLIVMTVCCLFAVDKALDVQVIFYDLMRTVVRAAEDWFDFQGDRWVVRGLLLVGGIVGIALVIRSCVRRDRDFDRGKRLAIAGLLLVVLMVGARLLPGFAWLADQRVGWAIEVAACGLVAAGVRAGFVKKRSRT